MAPASTVPTIEPIAPCIGALVRGVDLHGPLQPATVAAIKAAFLAHKVLVFPDQHDVSAADQKRFGAHFGEFARHPFRPAIDGHPELLSIAKEADEAQNVGGGWHTDMTFLAAPPLGSLLYAVQLPPPGLGDTLFADVEAAYSALTPGLREVLDRLSAVHSAQRVHGPDAVQGESGFRRRAAQQALASDMMCHPVVRTHPETGRRGLFVNPLFTVRFAGWSDEESRPLLEFLFAHIAQPRFVLRVRWQVGTLTLWDNRCTQHNAMNDYHGHRREMRRLMITGDNVF